LFDHLTSRKQATISKADIRDVESFVWPELFGSKYEYLADPNSSKSALSAASSA